MDDQEFHQSLRSKSSLCSITEEAKSYRELTFGGEGNKAKSLRGKNLCIRSPSHSDRSPEKQWERHHNTGVTENNQMHPEVFQYGQDYAYEHKGANLARPCSNGFPEAQSGTRHNDLWMNYDGNSSLESQRPELNHALTNNGTTPTNASQRDCTKEKDIYTRRARPYLSCQDKSSRQQESGVALPHRPTHKRAASVDTPLVSSPTDAPKYMSWDNLLMLAGLQPKSVDFEDGQNDDLFSQSLNASTPAYRKASLPGSTETESPLISQDSSLLLMKAKKGRSHSFCCDNGQTLSVSVSSNNVSQCSKALANMNANSNGLSKAPSAQNTTDREDSVFASMHMSVAPDRDTEKTNAIIRRASIQCETVLTGGMARNRKIFNPLHEIDFVSLRSPGPLHAVTLQYNGMPLNALPEDTADIARPARGRSASVDLCALNYQTVSKGTNPKETHSTEERLFTGQRLPKHRANSTKQSIRQNLQPILENGHKTSASNSLEPQNENKDINSNLLPQTSDFGCKQISKMLPEQEAHHLNSEKNEIDRSTSPESVSNDVTLIVKSSMAEIYPTESQNPTKSSPPSSKNARENSTEPISSKAISDSHSVPVETSPSSSSATTCQANPKPSAVDLCPSPPSPPLQYATEPQNTADMSLILSDDGYSTCDSLGPRSRLSIGPAHSSSSSSDWSSLSSGSVSNVSVASVFSPSYGISANKRVNGSRHPRFSHPPNSSRADPDPRSKSCSAIRPDGWPSCSTLTYVPEGSNSDTASSTSLCQDEPERNKDIEPYSFNGRGQMSSTSIPESVLDKHESTPDIDSVFSDDIQSSKSFQTHSKNISSKIKDSNQNINVPTSVETNQTTVRYPENNYKIKAMSSDPLPLTPNSVVMLEEGAVIQLEVDKDQRIGVPQRRFPSSSKEGQKETLSRCAKRNVGRTKLLPNKGVRQTAV